MKEITSLEESMDSIMQLERSFSYGFREKYPDNSSSFQFFCSIALKKTRKQSEFQSQTIQDTILPSR